MTDEKKNYRVTDRRHSATEISESEPDTGNVLSGEHDVAGAPPAGETMDAPASFTAFVLSLGAQAGMLLNGIDGGAPDLSGARWLISILEMLRDKTEGRRSADETDALDSVLYELRMGFVQRTRAGGA